MSDPPERTPEIRPPLAEELPDDAPIIRTDGKSSFRASPDVLGRIPAVESAETEALLRQANLLRVRGDFAGAASELRKAVELNPSSGNAHEMLGDVLVKAGDADLALASYRAAQSAGAGPAIEAKIARIIVKRDAGHGFIGDQALVRGSGPLPIIASALVPGMGLILVGETRPAVISIGGWLVTLSLMFAVPQLRAALPFRFGEGMGPASAGASFTALLLGLANLAFYVYSLIETARVAKPTGKDG